MKNSKFRIRISLMAGLIALLLTGCTGRTEDGGGRPRENGTDTQVRGPETIDAERLSALMEEEPALQVLDVRTPAEFSGGYVEGALNINVHDADFPAHAEEKLDKTKPVAVICAMGGRSARAAKMLHTAGFQKIYNVGGGMNAWIAKNLPLAGKD